MSARGHQGLMLSAAGGSDPYWANVTSLLHFDGNFTDEKGNLWTAANASIATSSPAPKFGSGSGSFPGSSSVVASIQAPASAGFGFGSGDFTIEGWLNPTIANTYDQTLFDNRSASNQGIGIYSDVVSGGSGGLSYANNTSTLVRGTSFIINTWTHWAVTRAAGTVRGFLNGAITFTTTDSRTLATSASAFYGANYVAGQPLRGNLDECRITKGIARYTANFTPPTSPFPSQ